MHELIQTNRFSIPQSRLFSVLQDLICGNIMVNNIVNFSPFQSRETSRNKMKFVVAKAKSLPVESIIMNEKKKLAFEWFKSLLSTENN